MKAKKLLIKIVTGILFGLLILSFAVWGIGDIFREGGQTQVIAEVGTRQVSDRQFSQDLNREINRLSQQFGSQITMEQAQAFGIVQQVLDRQVGQALFAEQAHRFGMTVTEPQIQQEILEQPAFKDQFGDFSRDRFIQVLRSAGLDEASFVAAMTRDIEREQISRAVIAGVQGPRNLAELLFNYQAETRVADFVRLPHDGVTDLPEATDEQLQTFYDENADSFMTDETRDITLVQIRPDDLLDEIAVPEEEVKAEFEDRKEQLSVPERRTIEQIVLNSQEEAQAAKDQIAGGADWAAVAQEQTGSAPISLGTLSRQELFPDLGEPAFALEVNAVSDPVNTPLGWHILRVTEVEAGEEAVYDDVKDALSRELALALAVDDIISIANQFDDELAAGSDLDEAAAAIGLQAQKITGITGRGTGADGLPLENVPPLALFLEQLREIPEGESGLLTETDEGGYFAIRVDKVHPAEQKPFEDVRDQTRRLWQGAERARLTQEKAQALADKVGEGQTLASLAEAEGLAVETTPALTRYETNPQRSPANQLAGQLFGLDVGEATTANGNQAEVVAVLKEVIPADPAADQVRLEQSQENLGQALQSDLLEQYMAAMRDEYGVRVNQGVLQRILNPYQTY